MSAEVRADGSKRRSFAARPPYASRYSAVMCYSAQVYASWRMYMRNLGADISVEEFYRLFWQRNQDAGADDASSRARSRIQIPKALELEFACPVTDHEREIKALIDAHSAGQALALEQKLFDQRRRLADAEREISERQANGRNVTKQLLNEQRVATNKVDQFKARLGDLSRTDVLPRDLRIFPDTYCPVLVVENDRLTVMPMRYHCLPVGVPAFYDTKYPGTYNARRDNLEGPMWRGLFGTCHGIMLATSFYEHVKRHRYERRELREGEREEDVVLEFRPNGLNEMLVACLWSRRKVPGHPDLLSFAAITDEPPPEVAAAGHDRCIIPIRPENVEDWLRPDRGSLDAQYAILDDRERPHYGHLLAA